MPQEILFGIYAEIRETRAELKAHRENSDERNRSIHKRLDRFEDHTRSEIKDLRSKMERSKAPTSALTFGSVLSALITNWEPIAKLLALLLTAASVFGLISPDKAKALLGLQK